MRYYPEVLGPTRQLIPDAVEDALRRAYDMIYIIDDATGNPLEGNIFEPHSSVPTTGGTATWLGDNLLRLVIGPVCTATTNNYSPPYFGTLAVREYMTVFSQTNCRQMLGLFVDKINTLTGTHEDRCRILSTRYNVPLATDPVILPLSIEVGDQDTAPSIYIKGGASSASSGYGNVAMFTNTLTDGHDFTGRRSTVGGIVSFLFGNSDATNTASDARSVVQVGFSGASGATAGDPYTYYDISNVGGWTLGIDNSDSDKFKFDRITGGTKNPGTNTAMTIDTSKQVGIQTSTPNAPLEVSGSFGSKGQLYVNATTGQHSYMTVNSDAGFEAGITISKGGTFKWNFYMRASQADLMIYDQAASADKFFFRQSSGNFQCTGNLLWQSGTSFVGTFDHAITADRTWTFQNVTGTIYQTGGTDVAIADGGTNSSTALNNGRVMISSGGAIVERSALTASALVVGDATNGVASFALGTANQIVGMNSGATANEYKTLSGTSNQITVTHGANSITLSTPQDINTSSSPTFSTLTASTSVVTPLISKTSADIEVRTTTSGDIYLNPAGSVKFGTHSAIGAETVTGYITILDSAGNSRKLAVVS